MVEADRNPEFPDPFPNESTVIAKVIGSANARYREGLKDPVAHSPTLAERGAMGHHGDDDYATCNERRHWERIPAGVLADDLLADEIEMDLL